MASPSIRRSLPWVDCYLLAGGLFPLPLPEGSPVRLGQFGLLESEKVRFAMMASFHVKSLRGRPVGRTLCSHRFFG